MNFLIVSMLLSIRTQHAGGGGVFNARPPLYFLLTVDKMRSRLVMQRVGR